MLFFNVTSLMEGCQAHIQPTLILRGGELLLLKKAVKHIKIKLKVQFMPPLPFF